LIYKINFTRYPDYSPLSFLSFRTQYGAKIYKVIEYPNKKEKKDMQIVII